MGKKEKLIERLLQKPKDMTFDEVATLLSLLGYTEDTKGKTSGSRVAFWQEGKTPVLLHRPHPQKEIPSYQIGQIIEKLKGDGLL